MNVRRRSSVLLYRYELCTMCIMYTSGPYVNYVLRASTRHRVAAVSRWEPETVDM
jgi:hypothetical protein